MWWYEREPFLWSNSLATKKQVLQSSAHTIPLLQHRTVSTVPSRLARYEPDCALVTVTTWSWGTMCVFPTPCLSPNQFLLSALAFVPSVPFSYDPFSLEGHHWHLWCYEKCKGWKNGENIYWFSLEIFFKLVALSGMTVSSIQGHVDSTGEGGHKFWITLYDAFWAFNHP